MSDYILKNGVLYHSNDYLMHYGKKGMKWKNHRYVENGNRPPDKDNVLFDGIYKYAKYKPKNVIDAYKRILKNTNRETVPRHLRIDYDRLINKIVKDYNEIREEWLKPNSTINRTK